MIANSLFLIDRYLKEKKYINKKKNKEKIFKLGPL
jgi:hypothetical protein